MNSAALIANPHAGPGRRPPVDEAVALLDQGRVEVEVLLTTRGGEATSLAAAAARRHSTVFAMGGDGTVHEVATGLLGSSAALGLLPVGSGNDLARGLGIADYRQGVAAFLAGRSRRIDACYIDEEPFFNSAGFFLSGQVSGGAVPLWRGLGRLRYVVSSLTALAGYRAQPARWLLADDTGPREGRWLLAEICNGPRTGGGFQLAPDADFGDGLLDLCLVRPISVMAALKLLPAAAAGRRIEHAAIERIRTQRCELELPEETPYHLDGEPGRWPAGRYSVRTEPGVLTVAVPPPAAGQKTTS